MLAALAAVVVLLDGAFFAVRPPWRVVEVALAKPELPPKADEFRAQLAGGGSGQEFSVTLSDEGLTVLVGEYPLDPYRRRGEGDDRLCVG